MLAFYEAYDYISTLTSPSELATLHFIFPLFSVLFSTLSFLHISKFANLTCLGIDIVLKRVKWIVREKY